MILFLIFFFNDTATSEIYTLSLHDALPISQAREAGDVLEGLADGTVLEDERHRARLRRNALDRTGLDLEVDARSEEHTSELQSRQYLVCRLLLEKNKCGHTYRRGM